MARRILILLIIALSFWACKKREAPPTDSAAAAGQAVADQREILKINDASFTNSDLKDFIRLQYSNVTEKKNSHEPGLLSVLFKLFVEQKLLLYCANKEGITAGDTEIDAYLKKINVDQPDQSFDRSLVRDMVKIQQYLSQKIYNGISVTDAEMEKYFQEHMADFNKSEEILLFQILLDNRDKAIKIRGELANAPGRFEDIARKESRSGNDAEVVGGGKMGYFEKGQLPKEMEDVVFSLRKNEISPVVESPYGFHIFKVTEIRNPKKLSFFQVKNDIRDKLMSLKMSEAYQSFLQRLKSETAIQINKGNLYFPFQETDGEIK